jgi:hypothetical protein
VVFKDRVIAATDYRYRTAQLKYENRLTDLRANYSELSQALVSAEDRFKSTADQFQIKQHLLDRLVYRKSEIDRALVRLRPTKPLPNRLATHLLTIHGSNTSGNPSDTVSLSSD